MTRDMAALWTFEDAVNDVLDSFDEHRIGRALRIARAAVLHANRTIANDHDWQWLITRTQFRTEAVYETGTVEYDNTTRELTLSGGTWPDNAALGNIVIDDDTTVFPIATRESATVCTLGETNNPGEDVAASSYRWYRDEYELPSNMSRNFDLCDLDTTRAPFRLRYVAEDEIRAINYGLWSRYFGLTDTVLPFRADPEWYTIRKSDKYDSGFSLAFSHIPTSPRLYEMSYWRSPRRLLVERLSTSVSSTSGSRTITGSGFLASHVGSVIRVSSTTAQPTGPAGSIDSDADELYNPYAFQGYIDEYVSASEVTLLESATATVSSKPAVISDPIDIHHPSMLDYFLMIARVHYAQRTQREDVDRWIMAEAKARTAAKEADRELQVSRGLGLHGSYR